MLIYRNAKRVHCQRKVGNPCSINLGLMGNFGRMHGLLSCEVCFFRGLRHKVDS